jgi:hypothetical protein
VATISEESSSKENFFLILFSPKNIIIIEDNAMYGVIVKDR